MRNKIHDIWEDQLQSVKVLSHHQLKQCQKQHYIPSTEHYHYQGISEVLQEGSFVIFVFNSVVSLPRNQLHMEHGLLLKSTLVTSASLVEQTGKA